MRRNITALMIVMLVILLAFAGCSRKVVAEKDIQVALEVEGTLKGSVTVNEFNNAILEEPVSAEGRPFKGWTLQESWDESDTDNVKYIPNRGLVRYNDVKDSVKGDSRSVVLRAVFGAAARKDLVIAWYNKESTSGLNQGHMDAFLEKLKAYLRSEGNDPDKMSIAIRGYEGGVADTCAAISKDGDVDIMVGWSSTGNLTGTGGWTEGKDFLENVGGVTIGAKARYTARISDTDLSKKVYAWIQNEFGAGAPAATPAAETPAAAPAAETPAAEAPAAETPSATPAAETPAVETPAAEAPAAEAPAAQSDGKLVIGWYAKSATSGLNETIIARFEEAVRALIASGEYKDTVREIVIRPYDGNVADVQTAVLANGDVDVMVGMKAFTLEGIEMEVQQNIAMGEKTDRRIHRISDDPVAVYVFEWLKTEDARKLFVTN